MGHKPTIVRAKRVSKQRKGRRSTVPALGVVGMSLSLAGGTSEAATSPAAVTPSLPIAPGHEITLNEEEVADVSLATFYVFDKENAVTPKAGVQLVRGCGGCGGCRGCGGCGGFRGCRACGGFIGCRVGCRGCRCGFGCGCFGCGCGGGCGQC
jgi:hypothetical protein